MKKTLAISVAVMAAMALCACAKKPLVKDAATAGTQVPVASAAGAETGTPRALNGEPGADGSDALNGPLSGRTIYFDFDKSDIKPEFAAIVTKYSRDLAAKPKMKLRLEGNTDERGTREYNIGLGERRAQAVRRALMLQGAAAEQLTTVSFGEERPAVEGDDEAAWAKNRRVELAVVP
jgi:peptidoglycan-associated lipoprotein